jgi:transposase
MSQKTYQRYTPDFKEKALGLLALGKPIAEVAQDLEVSTNLLYTWRSNQSQRSQGGSAGLQAGGALSEADALRALRRDYARLQAENDILKKAAIILGSRPQLNCAK